MSKSVLDYVQNCLSVMDSDEVDSIGDTTESYQIATLLSDLYYELMNRQDWDFLNGGILLEAGADIEQPTRLNIPSSVKFVKWIKYNTSTDISIESYRTLKYVDPEAFVLLHGKGKQINLGDGVKFYVATDSWPVRYTSFDGNTIYFDGYKNDVETTITGERTSSWGARVPEFIVADSHIPSIPRHMEPLLQSTLNASSFLYFKQQESPVDEARVKRQLAQQRRKQSKLKREHYYSNSFGRR